MKMLRQPTWHRIYTEWVANRIIKRLAKGQKALLAMSPSESPTQKQKIYRIGIIGCGRVARRHVYGYLKSGRALLVAGSDPLEKNLRKAKRQWKMQHGYVDFREMLQMEKLDMISICAPPRFHYQAVMEIAHSKNTGVKAILCEKPIGLDLKEADEMIAACRENQIQLAIGHQRRFGPQHQLAKKLLKEDVIGEIHHLHVECPRDILRAGIHAADMLLDYIGKPRSVMACLSDGKGGPAKKLKEACLSSEAGDRQSMIIVHFENGKHATLRVENRSGLDATLYFMGEKGEMQLWWDGGLRYRKHLDPEWTIPELDLFPYFQEFYLEIESIMNALDKGMNVLIDGNDGRNSLELILAILLSNQESGIISLPLDSDHDQSQLTRSDSKSVAARVR